MLKSPEAKERRRQWERAYAQTPKRRAYVAANAKAWREKNKEHVRKYHEQHREHILEMRRLWRLRKKEERNGLADRAGT